MSDSSDYSTSEEEIKEEKKDLSLQEVNEMVREYEKMEKKERKKHSNRNDNIGEIKADPELLSKITLSQRQMKMLKPKKERTPKQQEQFKKVLDIRKQKLEEDKAIKLKVAETRKYVRKPKPEVKEEDIIEFSEEEEKPKSSTQKSAFQARKPKLEEPDPIEEKVNKLNNINNMLNNPFYAQIMKSRGIKI